jgi:hypothetical protein
LTGVLAVAVCAVLAEARSFAAIGDWAQDLGVEQLDRLGLRKAPTESTIRKLFARLDAAALASRSHGTGLVGVCRRRERCP